MIGEQPSIEQAITTQASVVKTLHKQELLFNLIKEKTESNWPMAEGEEQSESYKCKKKEKRIPILLFLLPWCPMPFALCPLPFALCPMPFACALPHAPPI